MPSEARLIGAFHRGEDAYYEGQLITANPHGSKIVSDVHIAWDAGWLHAEHECTPLSSRGRTTAFEAVNCGSNPQGGTK
jgi:hypothetical protein